MKQLKEKQQVKDGPEWGNMNPRQQQEFESNVRQIGMIARYHNVMGRYTIHSLELITREIKTIFCHAMMVERIAGMLNYFLLHLVCVAYSKLFILYDKSHAMRKSSKCTADQRLCFHFTDSTIPLLLISKVSNF